RRSQRRLDHEMIRFAHGTTSTCACSRSLHSDRAGALREAFAAAQSGVARRTPEMPPMKLGLINSAWAQAGRETSYGIRMTKEIGFDSIDIFTDPLDIDVKERRLIKHECDRAGLPIVSVACVAVGLIDFNPSVQRFHVQRCKAFLDMVYEYEAKNLLLVL